MQVQGIDDKLSTFGTTKTHVKRCLRAISRVSVWCQNEGILDFLSHQSKISRLGDRKSHRVDWHFHPRWFIV